MRFTRRNTIIGLGTLAAGAGVIGGSGAFSQVQANRDFEVQVEGDAAALLALEPIDTQIAGTESDSTGNNEVLYFTLNDDEATGINADALTIFEDAFRITNNGDDDVEVSIDTGDANGVSFVLMGNDLENLSGGGSTVGADLAESSAVFEEGEAATVDVEIDTRGDGYVEPSDGAYQMVITANSVPESAT